MFRTSLSRSAAVFLLALLALFLAAPPARAEARAAWSGPAGLLRLVWSLVAPWRKEGSDLDPDGSPKPGPHSEAGSSLDPSGATIEEGSDLDPSGATLKEGGSLDPDGAR